MKRNLAWISWLCQVIAMLILWIGVLDQSIWFLIPVNFIWMALFGILMIKPRGWLASLNLVSGCLIAAGLSVTEFPILWLVISVAALLSVWDMQHLRLQFAQFRLVEGGNLIIRAHLIRLGIVAGLCLVIVSLSISIEMSVKFGWLLVIGMVALVGLSLVFRNIRLEN